MSKVIMSIDYAGLELRVFKNEEGQEVVPLKPISDLFGLNWKSQHEKITNNSYLSRLLGVCIPLKRDTNGQSIPLEGDAGNQKINQTCILLSKVSAFLLSLNPDRIRSNGNIAGADYLDEKQSEWYEALHDYETIGVAINMNVANMRSKNIRDYLALGKHKLVASDKNERSFLNSMMRELAKETGHPYQYDDVDEE